MGVANDLAGPEKEKLLADAAIMANIASRSGRSESGGRVARWDVPRSRMQPADWRFSQDENHDAVKEVSVTASATSGWIPTFADYL